MKPRIGVLTSGGDCPGLNAVLRGVEPGAELVDGALHRVDRTATSHRRVIGVKVMGRHAGWIALHGGIAGGADIILIPEIPFEYGKTAGVIKAREAAGCLGRVIVV